MLCTRDSCLKVCERLKVFEKLGNFFFKGILFRIRQMVELKKLGKLTLI